MPVPLSDRVRDAFLSQARACDELGSPFTARLCRLLAARPVSDPQVGCVLANWPGRDPGAHGDSVPLRLAGGLHALVLEDLEPGLAAVYPPHRDECDDNALWFAVDAAVSRHSRRLLQWLDRPPQTNEVQRSAALVPGFLLLSRRFGLPLVLSEVGASAGLNLFWDRYGYRLGALSMGDPGSPVQLRPDWTGPPPPSAQVRVAERRGCDLAPLDPTSPEDRLRLLAYIWPDQRERLARTRAALEIAAAAGGSLVDGEGATDWLERRLARDRAGCVHVVYHSIAWQYLSEADREWGRALIEDAGRRASDDAPLAWLGMEADGRGAGAAVTLRLWPGDTAVELARADFHGRWVSASAALSARLP